MTLLPERKRASGAYRRFEREVKRYIARILRRYQIAWLANPAAFLAHLGARQIGKDFTWALRVALDMVCGPGTLWNALSATARHAATFLSDVRKHIQALLAIMDFCGLKPWEITKDSHTVLWLDNDSQVESHAATVRAVVGRRGNVLMNEVGVVPAAGQLYEAALPIVEGQLDIGARARFVMISNACPQGLFWHQLWTGRRSKGWAKVTSTWRACFANWLAQRGEPRWKVQRWIVAKVKARVRKLGSAAYKQWYGCEFRHPSQSYLDNLLLDRAGYDPDNVWDHKDPKRPIILPTRARSIQQVIGQDIGRHIHPMTIAKGLLWEGACWGLPVEAFWEMEYEHQHDELARAISQRKTVRAVIDSTGPGDAPAENAQKVWPHLVEPHKSSGPAAWALALNFKDMLQRGVYRYDRGDLDTRMELDGVRIQARADGSQKVVLPTSEGQDQGDRPTHGDRAMASLLCAWGARGVAESDDTAYDDALSDMPLSQPMSAGVADWSRLGGNSSDGW